MIEWNLMIVVEIQEMIVVGIIFFKMYMVYDNLWIIDVEIFEVMKEIKKVNGMLGVYCENGDLVDELI